MIFYKKLINFKKKEDSGIAKTRQILVDENHRRAKQIGEEYLRNWSNNGESGDFIELNSRDARKTKAPLIQEIKNIINEINERAEANVLNIPRNQNNIDLPVDENERINLEDTNTEPNTNFYIEFATPGESRGVSPENEKYYKFGKLGKTVEVNFKDNPAIKEQLQVFYKIDDVTDEEMRLRRTLGFTYSLKEHLTTESKTLTDLLESIRVFNSDLIKNGISSYYDQNTGLLEITFSSKRGIKEEFEKFSDMDSEDNKKLFSELIKEFQSNQGVKNILQKYNDDIIDDIFGIENEYEERTGGKVLEYEENDEVKNLIEKIINVMLSKQGEKRSKEDIRNLVIEKMRGNFHNEVRLRKEIFILQCFRQELLKSNTGLDGILEKIFKSKIAGNIMNQFKAISDVLSKSGLRMNPDELFAGIREGMNKEEKVSLNPGISYAHSKLEEMDKDNQREFNLKKVKWERENPGETYPYEFKSMLQKIKESIIDQIDKQIENKAYELQEVKNQQNDIDKMEDFLEKNLISNKNFKNSSLGR
jgi:hypothetical protein